MVLDELASTVSRRYRANQFNVIKIKCISVLLCQGLEWSQNDVGIRFDKILAM